MTSYYCPFEHTLSFVRTLVTDISSFVYNVFLMQVMQKNHRPFDVTMGSYDGCELCELVGLYILHKMRQKWNAENQL